MPVCVPPWPLSPPPPLPAPHRYTHLLRLVESTRDYETQEQLDAGDALQRTVLGNLALATHAQGEYARAVEWADRGLQLDPGSAKVRVLTTYGCHF
jgi:hypothetical protein